MGRGMKMMIHAADVWTRERKSERESKSEAAVSNNLFK